MKIWTNHEQRKLTELASAIPRPTDKEIGVILGRSENSVGMKVYRLKLPRSARHRWLAGDIEKLRTLVRPGATMKEIAPEFPGRTMISLWQMAFRLDLSLRAER